MGSALHRLEVLLVGVMLLLSGGVVVDGPDGRADAEATLHAVETAVGSMQRAPGRCGNSCPRRR